MRHYISILILSALLTACSSDFLDKLPESNYVDASYYQSDDALMAASAVLYNRPWFGYNGETTLGVSQLANDTFSPWGDPEYNTFEVTAIDQKIQDAWKSFYGVVTLANSLIYAIDNKSGGECTDSIKIRVKAEAKTLRAQAYFYMVRFWGPAILFENNAEVVDVPVKPLSTETKVFDFIINDLTYAADNLPDSWTKGRATKWTAKALLAKVYLARSGWNGGERDESDLEKCKVLCEDVIYDSGLNLLPNYEDLFKYRYNNNEESLLAMQWVPLGEWGTQNTLYSSISITDVTGGVSAWGSPFAAAEMLKLYERDDTLRRNATFFTQYAYYPYLNISEGGYTYTDASAKTKKGCIGGPNDDNDGQVQAMSSPLNTYMLRLADTYLTYAEACLGNKERLSGGKGLECFNKVRERAGIKPKESIDFNDIVRERRIEFCFEFCNWYDMVSWFKWKPDYMLKLFNNQERGVRYDKITKDSNGDFHFETPYTMTFEPVTASKVMMPYPENEVVRNHYLNEDPQ